MKRYIDIVHELQDAIKDGYIMLEPKNSNRMLVYRYAGAKNPEGWYSEDILDVAQELYNDPKNYKEFRMALDRAKNETKEGK